MMWHIRTILHPNDLSETSGSAFDMACALARDYRAELQVLHVYPPPVNGADAIDRERDDDLESDLLDELRKQTPHDPSIRIDYRLRQGIATEWIVEAAKRCDLIVMGTHGRAGVSRAIMGSVAEHVLREAPCPVVIVRRQVTLPAEATASGVPVGPNSLNAGM